MAKVDPRIASLAAKVKGKRPRAVIDHILKHGFITTQQLKDTYGYNHPPRAARDVREQGIPLDTFRVIGEDGRSIAAYRFGDPALVRRHKLGGRKVFSKAFKTRLIERQGSRCAITGEKYESLYLQIDHRIPYEIAGDDVGDEDAPEKFMLISGAAQRQKSWSCEHCFNFTHLQDSSTCQTCYWASPEQYSHVATVQMRRVELLWTGIDTALFDALVEKSNQEGISLQQLLKDIAVRSLS